MCVSVSQNVFPPPVEPTLPDAGPGPVLLLLGDRRPLHVPEQVSGETVQRLSRLQQPASRSVPKESSIVLMAAFQRLTSPQTDLLFEFVLASQIKLNGVVSRH